MYEIFGSSKNHGKKFQNCVRPPLVVSFIPDEGQFKPLDIIAEA